MALQTSQRGRRRITWFIGTSFLEALGDGIARSLMPIVAVTVLGAGTGLVGVINSLGLLAFLVLSLPIGVFADRHSAPTRLMSASSLVRALVAASGLAAWACGLLQSGAVLLAMAATVGVADVVFTSARGLLIPRLAEPDRIRDVVGRVQTVSQLGSVAAPLVLTVLLGLVSAPLAWIAAAAAYVLSVFTQLAYRDVDVESDAQADAGAGVGADAGAGAEAMAEETPVPEREPLRSQVARGIGHLWRTPLLRNITAANALTNISSMAANTLLPVLALRTFGMASAHFALAGSLGSIAGIAGAAVASRWVGKVGLRAVRLVTSAVLTLGTVALLLGGGAIALLPGSGALWVFVEYMVAGVCTSVAQVAGSDIVVRHVPRGLLGTVAGAQRTVVLGSMPVSAVVFGALGSAAGMPVALVVWAGVTALALIPSARLVSDASPRLAQPTRRGNT